VEETGGPAENPTEGMKSLIKSIVLAKNKTFNLRIMATLLVLNTTCSNISILSWWQVLI
jgi:hypothetical protein